MARVGKFGHRPHASGNLSQLIASLYREERQAQDSVMFDAYQNGGLGIDGKPVTDASMKKYIAGRRDEFAKDDPTWSEWNNRLIQLNFKIGEEKVQLSYQQGKVGAGAVAAFYREQLSKIPRDSEFYRTVAGRAAQWAKAGAAAARGRARSRLTDALNAKQDQVAKVWGSYTQLEAVLTAAAKRAGLIAGNETLTDADATDLEAFLKKGVPFGNTTITFDDWRHAAIAAYKAFDTQIAVNKQLNRGTKTLEKQKGQFLDQNLVRINTIDARSQYEEAQQNFLSETQNLTDPRAYLAAAQKYAATLAGIRQKALAAGSGVNADDPEFIGGLQNEINALTTGKASGFTVADLQRTSTESVSDSYGQRLADAISKAQADSEALANGTAFYGQDSYGGGFKVIQTPPAGNLDPFGKGGLDDSYQQSVVNIDGQPTQAMLKGQPIYAFGLVDPKGQPVTTVPINGHNVPVENLTTSELVYLKSIGYHTQQDDKGTVVGYVFTENGKTTYGIKQTDGSLVYTANNPFQSVTGVSDNGLGVLVGTSTDNTGKVVTNPPNYDQTTLNQESTPFLADESVTPKDLRTLAAATTNASQAAALNALADKRENDARTEFEFTKNRGSLPGSADRGVISVFNGVLDTVKSLFGPTEEQPGATQPTVPTLPPLGNTTPQSFAPPVVTPNPGNATPKSFAPPPPPVNPGTGALAGALTGAGAPSLNPGSGALAGALAGAGVVAPPPPKNKPKKPPVKPPSKPPATQSQPPVNHGPYYNPS